MAVAVGSEARGARLRRRLRAPARTELALLALVLLAATVVRVFFLREPMRFDEAFTFQTYALRDLHGITLSYDTPNNHVLNTLLMHYSVDLFGDQTWAIRLPAFLTGLLVPLAAWWAGREHFGRGAALWAAVLGATGAQFVDYSVNGRGYIIGVLLVLVALACAARMLREAEQWSLGVFVVAAVLAVWAVPTMAYGLAIIALWMVATAVVRPAERLRLLRRVGGALATVAVLAFVLLWPLTNQSGWTFVEPLPRDWDDVWGLARFTWGHWNRTWPHPVDWLIAAGFLASLVLHRRVARGPVPLGAALVAGLLLIVALTDRLGPFPRSWIGLLPIYAVVAAAGVAAGVDALARRVGRPALASAAAVALATLVLTASVLGADAADSESPPQSEAGIVNYLRGYQQGRELLLDYTSFASPTDYYLRRFGYPVGVNAVTPRQKERGSVLILVQRRDANLAKNTVRARGGAVTDAPPRLVGDFEYVSVYDVALEPTP